MNKPIDQTNEQVLDDQTLELLGANIKPVPLLLERTLSLRARIMDSIEESVPNPIVDLVTIRASEGDWQEIAPLIYKKVLHIDLSTGIESYLLRVESGAQSPAHEHPHDELCLVLEGEVYFEDIHLKTGDYHFAPKGSLHGIAQSETGALLFLQSGLAA